MICIFTGGRDYNNRQKVKEVIDALRPDYVHVGDCKTGLDRFVKEYVMHIGLPHRVHEAEWDEHGKAAGPIRNRKMLEDAAPEAIVVAFDGSKGTRNCMKTAMEMGKVVFYVSEITTTS